jgi:hypothetical protein
METPVCCIRCNKTLTDAIRNDCGGCAEPEPEPEPDPCETCGNADCAEDCDKYKQWLTMAR